MALARAALSEKDRRFVIAASGGCCNKCKISVFSQNEFMERARLCDDAHIFAYSKDGPRGTAPGAPSNRNGLENIILLCKNCHAEVDQQPTKFTPAGLHQIRQEHYEWVRQRLGSVIIEKPRFHYILYLNAPRVDMYAVANSIALPEFDFGGAKSFEDLGFKAGQVMATYTHVLNSSEIDAHRVDGDCDLSKLSEGSYCFVEPTNFRTRAIDEDPDLQSAWKNGKSLIYRRFANWDLVCQIDPRWITTSSARSTLKSGNARLCGVVRINRIHNAPKQVVASPLFLAQP